MRHMETKLMFLQRLFGINAGLPKFSCRCIHSTKAGISSVAKDNKAIAEHRACYPRAPRVICSRLSVLSRHCDRTSGLTRRHKTEYPSKCSTAPRPPNRSPLPDGPRRIVPSVLLLVITSSSLPPVSSSRLHRHRSPHANRLTCLGSGPESPILGKTPEVARVPGRRNRRYGAYRGETRR